MQSINSYEALQKAYFNKCAQTNQFLMGVRDVKNLSRKHYCLVGFEDGQPLKGEVRPIAFHEPFWWPAIATFVGVTLEGEVLRKVEQLDDCYDGVICGGIE